MYVEMVHLHYCKRLVCRVGKGRESIIARAEKYGF